MANILASYYLQKTYRVGHRVRVGDFQGEIIDITATSVLLETAEGRVSVPASSSASRRRFCWSRRREAMDGTTLIHRFISGHVHQAARVLENRSLDELVPFFDGIPAELAASLFNTMEASTAAGCLERIDPERAADALARVPLERAALLLRRLLPETRKAVLRRLPPSPASTSGSCCAAGRIPPGP